MMKVMMEGGGHRGQGDLQHGDERIYIVGLFRATNEHLNANYQDIMCLKQPLKPPSVDRDALY